MARVREYSIQERLESIIKLQKIDSKLDEIKKLRGELPMEVQDLEDEIAGYQTRIDNVNNNIKEIEDYIKERKENQGDAQNALKKYEKQQNDVKNSREYEAINKQIEVSELDIKEAEKDVKMASTQIEDRELKKEETEKLIAQRMEVLNIKKEELQKISEETEKEEKSLKKERVKAEEDVFPRLLVSYNKIRENFRNGLAVVSVERDSCGGCHSAIPPQSQSEIRLRKRMTICEHCGRILVDEELTESVSV
jgi:predicted  nucleic acid-binding Zn-ribbon protein